MAATATATTSLLDRLKQFIPKAKVVVPAHQPELLADLAGEFNKLCERRQAWARKKYSGARLNFTELQIKAAKLELKGASHHDFGPHLDRSEKIKDLHPDWVPPWDRRIVKDHEFFAGCIERITVDPQGFLDHGDDLFRHAPEVRHLNLPRDSKMPEGFFRSESLNKLISLRADDCNITDDMLDGIESQRFLWLSLANNDITHTGVDKLARANTLRYVNLMCNPGDPLDPAASDHGQVTETWQPKELRDLERRITGRTDGRIPWFHSDWWPSPDRPPSRFLTPYIETNPK